MLSRQGISQDGYQSCRPAGECRTSGCRRQGGRTPGNSVGAPRFPCSCLWNFLLWVTPEQPIEPQGGGRGRASFSLLTLTQGPMRASGLPVGGFLPAPRGHIHILGSAGTALAGKSLGGLSSYEQRQEAVTGSLGVATSGMWSGRAGGVWASGMGGQERVREPLRADPVPTFSLPRAWGVGPNL